MCTKIYHIDTVLDTKEFNNEQYILHSDFTVLSHQEFPVTYKMDSEKVMNIKSKIQEEKKQNYYIFPTYLQTQK